MKEHGGTLPACYHNGKILCTWSHNKATDINHINGFLLSLFFFLLKLQCRPFMQEEKKGNIACADFASPLKILFIHALVEVLSNFFLLMYSLISNYFVVKFRFKGS